MQGSVEPETQAHTSFVGAQHSYLTGAPANIANSLLQSTRKDDMNLSLHGPKVKSPTSHYRVIPTDNQKFQRFIDLLFASKMQRDEIKEEVVKYVQLLETNYNATIRELKQTMEKERQKSRRANFEKVAEVSVKGDMENLFVECIEETRKNIMKRRLKNEILNSKKLEKID